MKAEDIEALKKLDGAIIALKAAGYEFSCHTITESEIAGSYKDISKRTIEMRCFKYFPVSGDGVRNLASFAKSPTC